MNDVCPEKVQELIEQEEYSKVMLVLDELNSDSRVSDPSKIISGEFILPPTMMI